ncbi:MAG: segregation/condensation protein A [Planctomycetes bacterium]|nr:segregation/condensation protein A [Planctomycetota bacterium]
MAPPSEFRPALEAYSGPLDLLLFLIKKEEVDVFDIPIARILEQYAVYLEILRELDPNSCGEFLVMAAHLMEIKSKLLLPREELPEGEEMEDPRLELVRQLLEYKKYKERALLLERRIEERRRRHERPRIAFDLDDVDTEGAVYLGNVTVWDIFTAFHKIQIALGAREPHRVVVRDRPLEDYIAQVQALLELAPARTALFDDLFADARSREEAIGCLLAILELAKRRRLSFHQEDLFGPIQVRLHTEEEVEELLAKVAAEAARPVEPAERFLLEGEGVAAALEPIPEVALGEGEASAALELPPVEPREPPPAGPRETDR